MSDDQAKQIADNISERIMQAPRGVVAVAVSPDGEPLASWLAVGPNSLQFRRLLSPTGDIFLDMNLN